MIQSCWAAVGLEVERDLRQREAQHGVVDGDEQHRQHEHGERDPAARASDAAGSTARRRRAIDRLVRAACCVMTSITIPSSRYSNRSWPDAARYDRAMSVLPHARESVLDAFEAILVRRRRASGDAGRHRARRRSLQGRPALPLRLEGGARRRALVDRSTRSSTHDIDAIDRRPRGPIAYFLRSLVSQDDPLDRAILATSRLAQGGSAAAARPSAGCGSAGERAAAARRGPDRGPRPSCSSSDGLYFDTALHGDERSGCRCPARRRAGRAHRACSSGSRDADRAAGGRLRTR